MLDGFGPDKKTTLPLLPFPMLKNQEDEFVPYIPSMEDLMAKDWIIDGFFIDGSEILTNRDA